KHAKELFDEFYEVEWGFYHAREELNQLEKNKANLAPEVYRERIEVIGEKVHELQVRRRSFDHATAFLKADGAAKWLNTMGCAQYYSGMFLVGGAIALTAGILMNPEGVTGLSGMHAA